MRGALILGACTALALAASAYLAAAEDAPKDNQGYTTQKALSKEIPSMAGWQLRLRVLPQGPAVRRLFPPRDRPRHKPRWHFENIPTRRRHR